MATQVQQPLAVRPGILTRLALNERRLAGLLLFILAGQFMTVIMLGASIVPAYDYKAAAISDLGVFPETALLFNVSLLAVGLLNLAGGYLFYLSHGRRWILSLFGLAGIGALGAGLFPLNVSELHSLFALVAFVAFNLQAIASGVVLPGPLRLLSVLAGVVGLIFVGVMIIGDSGNTAVFGAIGHGGTERMIVYPVMLWMLALGGYLMADRPETASGRREGGLA
jgi:hypothetical membrane protein